MKKVVVLLISIFFTAVFFSQTANAQTEAQRVELCTRVAGNVTFQSSYPIKLQAAVDGGRPPTFRQGIVLRKGNAYRFTLCTDEDSAGEAILTVFDEGRPIGSTFIPSTGVSYPSIDIECNKTAPYVIMVTFRDGKEGSAVAILSHVKTL